MAQIALVGRYNLYAVNKESNIRNSLTSSRIQLKYCITILLGSITLNSERQKWTATSNILTNFTKMIKPQFIHLVG